MMKKRETYHVVIVMVNSVRFVISEGENLASEPKITASVTQSFMWQKFYYSEKDTEKASDIDIRSWQRVPHWLVLSRSYILF